MKGQILDFSLQKNGGVISGDDGNRYAFHSSEWREQTMPARGMAVDFDVNENKHAVAVYAVLQKKAVVAANPFKKATPSTANAATGEPTLLDYAISVVKDNYVNFEGWARRKEYWGFCLFSNLIVLGLVILAGIGAAISEDMGIVLSLPYYVFVLAITLPNIAVGVRRLHDIDKSGWWMLVSLIPLAGAIWLIVMFATEGSSEENQYGEAPKMA